MRAVFDDLQDHSSALDGAIVHARYEVDAILEGARVREPFVCELEGENGYKLTIGIAKEVGCVQHSPSDDDVPYLMAMLPQDNDRAEDEEEDVEFLMGNTPTPIRKRYILPFDAVKEIVGYFVESGARSPEFSWEEI